jgi:hypothetical protein
MEENTPSSPLATLRPHHALCALFFEGKGYSQTFVDNMTTFLADPTRMLQITSGCDALCQACPNNFNGLCSDEAKVALFDQRTLSFTGAIFQADQPVPLYELCQSAFDNILQQGLLAEVCGECEWAKLCQGKWQKRDLNRSMLPYSGIDSNGG